MVNTAKTAGSPAFRRYIQHTVVNKRYSVDHEASHPNILGPDNQTNVNFHRTQGKCVKDILSSLTSTDDFT